MQRTFSLEQHEQRTLSALEQENMQALARVGALMMDLETARQQVALTQDKQRMFLRTALAARNVDQFQEARVINGQIVAQFPDEPALAEIPKQRPDFERPLVNGAPQE